MDIWVILLIVLIIVILYVLYQVTVSAALTQPMTSLGVPIEIKVTDDNGKIKIKNPTSKAFYYEGWFYVQSAPPQAGITNDTSTNVIPANALFTRITESVGNDIGLGLYNDNNTKKNVLALYSGKTGTGNVKGNIITEEYPLNKWVYIVVNVSNQLVEVYINGKLLKTIYLASAVSPQSTASIKLGQSGAYTGYSTRFNRKPDNIQADKVWEKYLQGNGQFAGILFGLLDYINNYIFELHITKNGEIKKQLSLGIGGSKTTTN